MKSNIKLAILIGFLVSIFTGCSDSPKDLGTDILEDDFGRDIVVVKEFNTHDTPIDMESEVFDGPDSLSYGAYSKVLLGKLNNLNSKFLMKFNTNLPDSVKIPLGDGDIKVLSARLEIEPNIIVGKEDITGFQFEMFKLNEVLDVSMEKDAVINYQNTNLVSGIVSKDSIITAEVDPDLIQSWLLESNGDSTANYGAYFTAENSVEKVIRINRSTSISYESDIRIVYIVQYKDEWKDTLKFVPQKSFNIINGSMDTYENDEFMVQGGIPVRSSFWFNKEQLPQGIAVNKATIDFYINEEKSILRTSGTDTLELNFYKNAGKDTLDFLFGTTYLTKNEEENSFSGEATNFFEKMIETDYQYGFRVKLKNESVNVTRIVLKNANTSDMNLRPKMTIKYSQRNK